jgi:hypothetical protein
VSVRVDSVRRSARLSSSFYFYMSVVFVLIAFGGFAPTYLIPVVTNQFDGMAILHVHGVLFFAWTLLFALQTRLVERGRVDLHRASGLVGISLATAMVFTGIVLVVRGLNYGIAANNDAGARALSVVPITQISLFAVFFAAAVANLRRSETHKRLMLLATVALLTAPVARIFLLLLVPDSGLPNFAAPVANVELALSAALVAALTVDLLIVVAVVHDWRTRGRPHRVYVIGGTCFFFVQVLRQSLTHTELWRSITDVLVSLGA